MMMTFLRAFLFTTLLLVGSVVATLMGVPQLIWANDPTFLSWAIIGLGVVLSGRMLYLTYQFSKGLYDKNLDDLALHSNDVFKDIGWIGSSLASRLGFLGTGIGMVMALKAFFGLDLDNPASLELVLSEAFVGVMTALFTTIVGLIVNMVLSVYSFNLGQSIRLEKLRRHDESENTFPVSV